MAMSTERFLVTGAAGCIGASVVRLLLDEGVPVVATDLSAICAGFELISQGRRNKHDQKLEFDELNVTSGADVAAIVADRGSPASSTWPACSSVLRRRPAAGARVNVVGTERVRGVRAPAGPSPGLRQFRRRLRRPAGTGPGSSPTPRIYPSHLRRVQARERGDGGALLSEYGVAASASGRSSSTGPAGTRG